MKLKCTITLVLSLLTLTYAAAQTEPNVFIEENTKSAAAQTSLMLQSIGEPTGKNFPRSINEDGQLATAGIYDWTSGFFPGSLWYLYELTGEDRWKTEAEKWTAPLQPLHAHTGTHDLGFMVYCSYGNAQRLDPKPQYKEMLVASAEALSSRFSETTGVIKSWDSGRTWDRTIKWAFPVIIDNMMNLELLFYASRVTGNKKYYDIAVRHADTSIKNHFREDGTTWHVVDYNPETGEVAGKATAQGYSDNSTWARGQAWAIYGYTMTYRETGDQKYLETAKKAADVYIANLPEDLVPLWDFNVGQEGYTPEGRSYATEFQEKLRDASAAAVVCSALFELGYLADRHDYIDKAVKMLQTLASETYRAQLGENGDFLLKHSVGSIPHRVEIDKPLIYADYYFLEALVRYRDYTSAVIKDLKTSKVESK